MIPVTRVAPAQWHALEDDLVVGRAEASRRPDGRMFASIDAWHGAAFERLADAMLAALPRPLYTLVDEADQDLTTRWLGAGFAIRRREWEYAIPTAPDPAAPPPGVTIHGFGTASEAPLIALDRAIRAEVSAGPGRHDMPAEVVAHPVPDPMKHAVAAEAGHYVGLLRLTMVTRRPRIGLIAVRSGCRRRGIARALLAHTLNALHQVGKETASTEVTESNLAATALVEGVGGRRDGSTLELVVR
jgi:GNAT superfamily N-acetyltransferase